MNLKRGQELETHDRSTMDTDAEKEKHLREWAQRYFKAGCYLGDLARSKDELTGDELFHLEMAYEGFLVGSN